MRTVSPKQSPTRLRCLFALCLCTPMLLGGCPEFQNAAVDSLSGATQTLVLGGGDPLAAINGAVQGIIIAVLDLFFEQLRPSGSSGSR